MRPASGDLHVARNDFERALFQQLKCLCGCLHALDECGGECGPAMDRRHEVQRMLDSGLSREQVLEREVQKYGVQVLRSPPDRGFNRLAWLLPALLSTAAAGILLAIAYRARIRRRRTRRNTAEDVSSESERDSSTYEDRLDDELDSLD